MPDATATSAGAVLDFFTSFEEVPIDHESIRQPALDLDNRSRTSLFPWRGQFSPDFVRLMLRTYTSPTDVVLDPFAGSGTTLFEACRLSLPCYGVEINPAAFLMASTIHFSNLAEQQRRHCTKEAETLLEAHLPRQDLGPLFSSEVHHIDPPPLRDALRGLLSEATASPYLYSIIANTILRAFSYDNAQLVSPFLWKSFREHKLIIDLIPETMAPCIAFHSDARLVPMDPGSADFIFTSPPYINVFNYHQNYREAVEIMGWDVLKVARSEVGSNRKHRGNRFFTVVQYAIEMLRAFYEMRRLITPRGRVIIVIGRESSVRGLSIRNSPIIAALAVLGAGFRLLLRQERKFQTKFGETIFEDILHFVPTSNVVPCQDSLAREVATWALKEAMPRARGMVRTDVFSAIQQAWTIEASPYFTPADSLR